MLSTCKQLQPHCTPCGAAGAARTVCLDVYGHTLRLRSTTPSPPLAHTFDRMLRRLTGETRPLNAIFRIIEYIAVTAAVIWLLLQYLHRDNGVSVGTQQRAHERNVNAQLQDAEHEQQLEPWRTSRHVAVLYVDGSYDPLNAPLIGFAIGNALGLLPAKWRVEVHTQNDLPTSLLTRFKDAIATGKLVHRLLKLPRGAERGNRRYTDGKAWAFTDPEWWALVDGDVVLTLHQTTCLCSGSSHHIDEFTAFDYVGAPWKWAKAGTPYVVGGNGALSIRSKAAVLRVLSERRPMKDGSPTLPSTNEDMFFVRSMSEMGGFNMSDRERGMRFAVEEIFYEAPLGVSYAMRTVPDAERAKVLASCPEARVLAGYLPAADWIVDTDASARCAAQTSSTPDPPCPWK